MKIEDNLTLMGLNTLREALAKELIDAWINSTEDVAMYSVQFDILTEAMRAVGRTIPEAKQ